MHARRHLPFVAGALTAWVACGSPGAVGPPPETAGALDASPGTPRAPGSEEASATDLSERPQAWFEEVRWQQRLLVVTGPPDEVEAQLAALLEAEAELLERDLLVIDASEGVSRVVLGVRSDAPTSAALRARYDLEPRRFTIALVGLDGGVKELRRELFEPGDIARVIDAMPMRQSELRGR